MAGYVGNSQRARDIVNDYIMRGDMVDMIERALNEAEDRGRAEAAAIPEADALTVQALRGLIRDTLTESNIYKLTFSNCHDASVEVTKAIIGNFRIQLMDESDCEKTDPVNVARAR